MNKALSWIEMTTDGILVIQQSGMVLCANMTFYRMTGMNAAETEGKNVKDLLFQTDGACIDLGFDRHQFRNTLGGLIPGKLMKMSGSLLNVCYKLSLFQDDEAEFLVISIQDTSDLMAVQTALNTERERMKEAKALAHLGHWELDLVSGGLYWSDEVYEMFGVDPKRERPSYEAFLRYIHPDDRDMVDKAYNNSVINRTEYEVVHRIKLNGETLHYKEAGKTYYSQDQPIKSVGLVQNITEAVQRQHEIEQKEQELIKTKTALVVVLMEMADLRDNETGKHIVRTQIYMRKIAQKLSQRKVAEFSPKYIELLYQVAPLHDIGKVGIPDGILRKPGKLTDDEYNEMKKHALIGSRVINRVKTISDVHDNEYLNAASKVILYHHERWDGLGYPYGLKGEEIPIEGRMMALVDVYDALRSKRVYKDAMSHEKSKEIILSESGSHFDPEVVQAFMELEKEFERISDELSD